MENDTDQCGIFLIIYLILLSYYVHSISYYSTSYPLYSIQKDMPSGPIDIPGRVWSPRRGSGLVREDGLQDALVLCASELSRADQDQIGPLKYGVIQSKSWNGMKMGWNIGSPSDKSPVDTVQWSNLSIHFSVSTSCWGGHRHIPHFDWRASLCRPGVTFDEMGNLFEAPWNHRTRMATIWIISVLWEWCRTRGLLAFPCWMVGHSIPCRNYNLKALKPDSLGTKKLSNLWAAKFGSFRDLRRRAAKSSPFSQWGRSSMTAWSLENSWATFCSHHLLWVHKATYWTDLNGRYLRFHKPQNSWRSLNRHEASRWSLHNVHANCKQRNRQSLEARKWHTNVWKGQVTHLSQFDCGTRLFKAWWAQHHGSSAPRAVAAGAIKYPAPFKTRIVVVGHSHAVPSNGSSTWTNEAIGYQTIQISLTTIKASAAFGCSVMGQVNLVHRWANATVLGIHKNYRIWITCGACGRNCWTIRTIRQGQPKTQPKQESQHRNRSPNDLLCLCCPR